MVVSVVMIAMTISSSTSVKPRSVFISVFLYMQDLLQRLVLAGADNRRGVGRRFAGHWCSHPSITLILKCILEIDLLELTGRKLDKSLSDQRACQGRPAGVV